MDNQQATIYVGSRELQVRDENLDISFPFLVHYPTHEPSTPTSFGPYMMEVSPQASIIEGQFPLIVISHGNSGSHFLYRTISTHLAKQGYIVAMLEHYGNNRNNNHLEKSIENLVYRPRHVSLTIDALLTEKDFNKHVLPGHIAVVGHSFGGYTALALTGGTPYKDKDHKIEVPHDPRVKAIVLMAPAAGWFIPEDSLANVNIPILLLSAEHDPYTPLWNADVVKNGVPDRSKVIARVIENAGHFSFLSPFPPAMKNPGFLPSTDPEGFDREQFHQRLPQEILNFLNGNLMAE